MLNNTLFLVVGAIALSLAYSRPNVPVLKGVTILNEPYIRVDHFKRPALYSSIEKQHLYGFLVDMMDEIAAINGFNYTLYLTPDHRYGYVKNGQLVGMLGQVKSEKADFALADMTVTDWRKEWVDFTEPFIDSHLVILTKKSLAHRIRSFSDLAQSNIPYGVLKSGSTNRFFAESTDPLISRMYAYMKANPQYMMSSYSSAYRYLSHNDYAFIGERAQIKYFVTYNCDLTYIEDQNLYQPTSYAIAVPKGSPYKQAMSAAIKELKSSGKLDQLIDKYWKTGTCNYMG